MIFWFQNTEFIFVKLFKFVFLNANKLNLIFSISFYFGYSLEKFLITYNFDRFFKFLCYKKTPFRVIRENCTFIKNIEIEYILLD